MLILIKKMQRRMRKKSKQLDKPLREKLAQIPADQRWLVTSEGAFSYLAKDYDLKEGYLWPINAEQQGTPQQVRKLIDLVKKNHIPVVFSESTVSDKPAQQVAKESGAKYGGVLYVDSLSAADGPVPTYIDLLNVTVSTIVKGFEKIMTALSASISVNDVTVRYNNGHTAFMMLPLHYKGGTICALVGVNGSGKSTLFKSIMGLIKPQQGNISLCGLPINRALKQKFGCLCAASGRSRLAISSLRL